MIPHHVKAHQDDIKDFCELSDWEKLNVLMDHKAKVTMKNISLSREEIDLLPSHQWSIPMVIYKEEVIRFDITKSLYNAIYKDKALTYWTAHQRFTVHMQHRIDWQAQHKAIQEVDGTTQRFISKWSSNFIGTGQNLVDWNMRQHGECPFCNNGIETTSHLLHCQDEEATELWDKEFQQYLHTLKQIGTSIMLRNIIITELSCWRDNKPFPTTTSLPFELQALIRVQRHIGWKNFLEGVLAQEWAQQQFKLKNQRYSYKKSRVWIKNVIKANWKLLRSLWQHRNEKLHNTQTILDREGHKELIQAVTKEWKIGLGKLPIRDFAYLFQIKWKKLKTSSTDYLKAWFAKVRLGRELYQDPALLEDEFSEKGPLRQWGGLHTSTCREDELNKALKRELRLGLSSLKKEKYYDMFQQKDIYTETYSIEKKLNG